MIDVEVMGVIRAQYLWRRLDGTAAGQAGLGKFGHLVSCSAASKLPNSIVTLIFVVGALA